MDGYQISVCEAGGKAGKNYIAGTGTKLGIGDYSNQVNGEDEPE